MKKRIFALLLSIAVILGSLSCITVFADPAGVDSETAETIKSAFYAYVDSVGNSAAADTMVEYINGAVEGVTVSIVNNTSDWYTNDWFIYHAVDGCYDETESYTLSIPGHDGYVSAIFTVSDSDDTVLGTVGAVASIPHTEENLGNLTMSVYSDDNPDFTTDANGNITNYSGTAEKIVIPYTYSGTINLNNAASKDIVKVVVIGSRRTEAAYVSLCNIANYSFRNWGSLRAVELPYKIKHDLGIGEYAFAANANLKYVDLPEAIAGTNGGFGKINYSAFRNCPVLENAMCNSLGRLPRAHYHSSANLTFDGSAIRYMVTASDGNYKSNCIPATHSYSDGVFVSLSNVTNDSNSKASLARAATLVQEAADNFTLTAGTTASSIDTDLTAVYSAKTNGGITSDWTTEPTVNTTYALADGIYTLELDGNTVDITFGNTAPIVKNIKEAFDNYVDSVGNSAAADTMVDYINDAVDGVSVSIVNNTSDWYTNDWFIYHAVDGCYDETPSYKLTIPGHDGYVSALLTVSDTNGAVLGTVGAVASIPHTEENLGNLTMSVYSADNTDFTTDANGNITNYSGTAEKIVIPWGAFSQYNKTINLNNATSKDIVKVVVIGTRTENSTYSSKCNIATNSFRNWGSLRAVSLPWRIQNSSGIGESAFAFNANLRYVDMPNAMAGTSSGYGSIGYGAFQGCPLLENAMCSHCGIMTTASYNSNGKIFAGSAIRYMVTPAAGSYKTNCIPETHSYSDGIFVSLSNVANDSNSKASLARAATLAQEAADKFTVSGGTTASSIATTLTSAYSAKTNGGITSNWTTEPTINTTALTVDDGVYTLELGGQTFDITVDNNDPVKRLFKSHSLALADSIGVSFVMDLSDFTAEEKTETYMTFAVKNSDAEIRVDFADATVSGDNFRFTCPLSSVQMAETVTPTFHYGSETVKGKPYSVKRYIDTVVTDFEGANKYKFSEELYDLVKSIGDYGHYAQEYFSVKNGWIAGTNYTALAKYRAADYGSDDYTVKKAAVAGYAKTDSGVTKSQCALNFNSKTSIGALITADRALSGIIIKQNGEAYEGDPYILKKSNYVYEVKVYNLPILQMDDTFAITDSEETFNVTLSGLSYVYSILNDAGKSTNLKNAVSAFYDYYKAADDYKLSIS